MALGKYRQLEPDLSRAPFGGGVGAKKFSDFLYRRCRCRLAWNKDRHVFTVYRMIGKKILTFMDLYPEKHFPLVPSLIPMVVSTIKAADAHRNADHMRSLREYMARQKKQKDDGIKSYVDDRFPDFKAYAEWSWNKINDRTSRPVVV